MPSRAWPFWLLTLLILTGFPALNFIYWPEVLRAGEFLPDGDSIAVPLFGSVLATMIFSPVVLWTSWLCLRRFNSDSKITTWRPDRPYRSIVLTVLFGTAAAMLIAIILEFLTDAQAWYDYLWPAYLLLWLPWLIGLRAAAVDQLGREDWDI
ncbi:MAG: hypothetical protein RL299_1703 [Pseudomonadota bacterium]|jgi:hypothetical protein